MGWHWGKTDTSLRLEQEDGSYSFKNESGQREIHRRIRRHRVTAMFGLSFGLSMFIGVIRFGELSERRERIK